MQFLILSDLHANWPALEAVLSDAAGQYEKVICCGDIVGYNANPSRVMTWAEANCELIVRGNHDKVVAGVEDLEWFNDAAKAAALWTMRELNASQIDRLAHLPKGPVTLPDFQVWHGSPVDEDEYISTPQEAAPRFSNFERPLAFFGHTHLQGGFFSRYGRVARLPQVDKKLREEVIEMEPDTLYMINPGSVGQPRDRDPRAAYALFDSTNRTVTLRRVNYAIQQTATAIKEAGLPEMLGLRLFMGF